MSANRSPIVHNFWTLKMVLKYFGEISSRWTHLKRPTFSFFKIFFSIFYKLKCEITAKVTIFKRFCPFLIFLLRKFFWAFPSWNTFFLKVCPLNMFFWFFKNWFSNFKIFLKKIEYHFSSIENTTLLGDPFLQWPLYAFIDWIFLTGLQNWLWFPNMNFQILSTTTFTLDNMLRIWLEVGCLIQPVNESMSLPCLIDNWRHRHFVSNDW